MIRRGRPAWLAAAVIGVAALVAACAPVAPAPAPPPPKKAPSTASTASACTTTTEVPPSAQAPVEYVAVLDDAGNSAPDVITFTASSPTERDKVVEFLELAGPVLAVEPDAPVQLLEDLPADSPDETPAPPSSTPESTSTTTAPDPLPAPSTVPPSTNPPAAPPPSAAPEESVGALVSTNDEDYGSQWGLPKSGFPGAWSAGLDGTDRIIAVLDTGVQANHPDLAGKVLPGADFIDGTSDLGRIDYHGHGTHVAGIAAASDNDVFGLGGAPEAPIVSVRVLNASGSGSFSDVAEGIEWAADHVPTPTVITMSLGAPGGQCSTSIQEQINYARSKGITVVAAAGNNNSNNIGAPGGSTGVITVGATTTSNGKASFSNYGKFVDLGAPGVSINSTKGSNSFGPLSGTSMSAPFVAAAVVLLKEDCPGLSPNGVLNTLKTSGTPHISALGARLLRIDRAVASC